MQNSYAETCKSRRHKNVIYLIFVQKYGKLGSEHIFKQWCWKEQLILLSSNDVHNLGKKAFIQQLIVQQRS